MVLAGSKLSAFELRKVVPAFFEDARQQGKRVKMTTQEAVPSKKRPPMADVEAELKTLLMTKYGTNATDFDLGPNRPKKHILDRTSGQKFQPTEDSRWSVQDAKNRFSELVDAAREKPQTVTKRGKPVVIVVAAKEYDRLRRLDKQKAITFSEHLLNIPQDNGTFERMKIKFRDPGF